LIGIKSLVIGLGNIGLKYDLNEKNNYLTHSQTLYKNKQFKLLGGVDINEISRKKFKNKFKLPVFESLEKYNLETPDLLVISTPNKPRASIYKTILQKKWNIKYLLVEKPLFSSLQEKKELFKLKNKLNAKIFVNFFWRTFPAIEVLRLLLKGQSKFKGTFTYPKDFFNQGCHAIDLLFSFFDNKENMKIKCINKDLLFLFNKDKEFIIRKSINETDDFSFDFLTEDYKVYFDGYQEMINIFKKSSSSLFKNKKIYSYFKSKKIKLRFYQNYVYNNIYKEFRGDISNICDFTEALRVTELINKVTKK